MKVGCQFLQARWAFKPTVGHCVARQFTLHQRDPQSDHHIARRKSPARPNCINPPSFHRFLPKPVIPKGTFPFSLFHSRPICTCYLLFVILIFDLLFLIFDFWFLIFDFWFLISDFWFLIFDFWFFIIDLLFVILIFDFDFWFLIFDFWFVTLKTRICQYCTIWWTRNSRNQPADCRAKPSRTRLSSKKRATKLIWSAVHSLPTKFTISTTR